MNTPEKELLDHIVKNWEGFTRHDRYIYAPRGGKVLAVVHTDVSGGDRYAQATWHRGEGGLLLRSKALDDRLGLYMLLQLCNFNNFDILLTTDEEIGNSSAADFVDDFKDKVQYNWLFQIDRRRTAADKFRPTAVMYEYETPEYRKLLEDAGIACEQGSFSDICSMEDLNVAGFNFSATYQNEHSENCHAYWSDVQTMIPTISSFITQHEDRKMPHTPTPKPVKKYAYPAYYSDEYAAKTTYRWPVTTVPASGKVVSSMGAVMSFAIDPRSMSTDEQKIWNYPTATDTTHEYPVPSTIDRLSKPVYCDCCRCGQPFPLYSLTVMSQGTSYCRRCIAAHMAHDTVIAYSMEPVFNEESGKVRIGDHRVNLTMSPPTTYFAPITTRQAARPATKEDHVGLHAYVTTERLANMTHYRAQVAVVYGSAVLKPAYFEFDTRYNAVDKWGVTTTWPFDDEASFTDYLAEIVRNNLHALDKLPFYNRFYYLLADNDTSAFSKGKQSAMATYHEMLLQKAALNERYRMLATSYTMPIAVKHYSANVDAQHYFLCLTQRGANKGSKPFVVSALHKPDTDVKVSMYPLDSFHNKVAVPNMLTRSLLSALDKMESMIP